MLAEAPIDSPPTTREEWLRAAVDHLRPTFAAQGNPLPPALQVSVGFPSVGAAFPHAGLLARDPDRKKQGTRLLKIVCPSCGYIARTTAKWIETGLPTCPCGTTMRLNGSE